MKTTWGVLDPPVGNTRLNVIRLISSLLQTNTSSVNQELIELNSIGVILVRTLCCLHFYALLLRSCLLFLTLQIIFQSNLFSCVTFQHLCIVMSIAWFKKLLILDFPVNLSEGSVSFWPLEWFLLAKPSYIHEVVFLISLFSAGSSWVFSHVQKASLPFSFFL